MITFVGHVSKDVNVVKGKKEIVPGGGVYYGSFAAKSMGANVLVLTKIAPEDIDTFRDMENFGISVIWIDSPTTTSIENVYPSDSPEDRKSRMISRANPFTEKDIEHVKDVVHITPLWHGEFPEDLLEIIRKKARVLSGDAQGFLRNVTSSGEMIYKDWNRKDLLKLFDVFKVDIREAEILTSESDPDAALERIADLGVGEIVLTSSEGVYIYKRGKKAFSKFEDWNMEGRTGRGDTAIASYLVLREEEKSLEELAEKVAKITTLKMRRKGPYRGWKS